jgi:hypothetical protein
MVEIDARGTGAQVGGGSEALDQRDGVAVAFAGRELGSVQQMARDHALYSLPAATA